MAIQTRTARLKLHDDGLKSLGAGNLTTDTVICVEGLQEDIDFAIGRQGGTIQRLKPFGRELYTFTFTYDDRSEAAAAEETDRVNSAAVVRNALVNLRAYADLASPTNAQTVGAVKLLCRVAVVLIRQAMGVRE